MENGVNVELRVEDEFGRGLEDVIVMIEELEMEVRDDKM